MTRLRNIVLIVAFSVFLHAQPACAQETMRSAFDDYFRLSMGLLSATADTELRLDADDGTEGTLVSGEDDLGLRKKSELGDVEADIRIRERHGVRFNYFRLDRQATQTLDRQIQFGNDLFEPGDVVDSTLDWHEFAVTYAYRFLRKERFELYGSFGIHLIEIEAEARVAVRDVGDRENEVAPAPAIGFGGEVRFSERFYLDARADYLSAHVGDYEATLLDAKLTGWFRFNRNLAVGLGYTYLEREAVSFDPDDSGHFKLRNAGAELFLRMSF